MITKLKELFSPDSFVVYTDLDKVSVVMEIVETLREDTVNVLLYTSLGDMFASLTVEDDYVLVCGFNYDSQLYNSFSKELVEHLEDEFCSHLASKGLMKQTSSEDRKDSREMTKSLARALRDSKTMARW